MLMQDPVESSANSSFSQPGERCEFYNLLCQQRDLYRELKVLTDRQHRAVLSGAVNQLLGVLSKRRSVLERLALMNKKIGPLQAKWNRDDPRVRSTQANEIRQVVGEVRGLLKDIIAIDQASRDRLQADRNNTSKQLLDLGQSNQSVKAYTATPRMNASALTDQTG